jgi:DNA uptake protein ComE-like DNA-binding protein
MRFFRYRHASIVVLLAGVIAGCNQQQSPQDIKEQTARATETVKRDAKAVAEGIREGWSRDKPLDLNSATKDQLLTLPGMTNAEADRVLEARPFNDRGELLSRHTMSQKEYDKISDLVTVRK